MKELCFATQCVVDVVNVTGIVRSHLNSCYIEISYWVTFNFCS